MPGGKGLAGGTAPKVVGGVNTLKKCLYVGGGFSKGKNEADRHTLGGGGEMFKRL